MNVLWRGIVASLLLFAFATIFTCVRLAMRSSSATAVIVPDPSERVVESNVQPPPPVVLPDTPPSPLETNGGNTTTTTAPMGDGAMAFTRIDKQHFIVRGRRFKVPFGTLPGTETLGHMQIRRIGLLPPGKNGSELEEAAGRAADQTATANDRMDGAADDDDGGGGGLDGTPPGCPHRFFTFVNNFGAHNNQLISLLNAFAVARNLSRTLVIPPFIQGLNEFATRRVIKPERYYNFSLFR